MDVFEFKAKASESIGSKTEDINYIRVIASGGYGSVWEAEWDGLKVAVKKLFAPDQKEINTSAKLEHENIIKLLDHRIDDSSATPTTIFILEYGDGGSLRSFLENSDPISPQLYFRWAKETALPVEYLELKHGLQHGDIKTSNIIIKNNVLKLADFGSAKKVDRSHTTTQAGTERWMAPEAMEVHHMSLTNNVYSVGLVLWELLTRELPFKKYKASYELMRAVIEKRESPPIPPFCPPELGKLIRDCWHYDPKERPTISNVIETIDKIEMLVLSSGRSQGSTVTEEKYIQTEPCESGYERICRIGCNTVDQANQTSDEDQRKLSPQRYFQRSVSHGGFLQDGAHSSGHRDRKERSRRLSRTELDTELRTLLDAEIRRKSEEIARLQTLFTQNKAIQRHPTGSSTVGQQKPKPQRKKKKRRGGQDLPA